MVGDIDSDDDVGVDPAIGNPTTCEQSPGNMSSGNNSMCVLENLFHDVSNGNLYIMNIVNDEIVDELGSVSDHWIRKAAKLLAPDALVNVEVNNVDDAGLKTRCDVATSGERETRNNPRGSGYPNPNTSMVPESYTKWKRRRRELKVSTTYVTLYSKLHKVLENVEDQCNTTLQCLHDYVADFQKHLIPSIKKIVDAKASTTVEQPNGFDIYSYHNLLSSLIDHFISQKEKNLEKLDDTITTLFYPYLQQLEGKLKYILDMHSFQQELEKLESRQYGPFQGSKNSQIETEKWTISDSGGKPRPLEGLRGGTAQITGDVNEKGPENFESVFMHIDSDGDFDMDSPAHSDSNKNDEDIIVASPSAVMQRNLVEASSGGTTCPMPYRLVLPWRPICELSPTPSSTLDTMDSIANSLKGSGSIGNLDYDANIIRSYIKVTTDHIKNLEIDQSIELAILEHLKDLKMDIQILVVCYEKIIEVTRNAHETPEGGKCQFSRDSSGGIGIGRANEHFASTAGGSIITRDASGEFGMAIGIVKPLGMDEGGVSHRDQFVDCMLQIRDRLNGLVTGGGNVPITTLTYPIPGAESSSGSWPPPRPLSGRRFSKRIVDVREPMVLKISPANGSRARRSGSESGSGDVFISSIPQPIPADRSNRRKFLHRKSLSEPLVGLPGSKSASDGGTGGGGGVSSLLHRVADKFGASSLSGSSNNYGDAVSRDRDARSMAPLAHSNSGSDSTLFHRSMQKMASVLSSRESSPNLVSSPSNLRKSSSHHFGVELELGGSALQHSKYYGKQAGSTIGTPRKKRRNSGGAVGACETLPPTYKLKFFDFVSDEKATLVDPLELKVDYGSVDTRFSVKPSMPPYARTPTSDSASTGTQSKYINVLSSTDDCSSSVSSENKYRASLAGYYSKIFRNKERMKDANTARNTTAEHHNESSESSSAPNAGRIHMKKTTHVSIPSDMSSSSAGSGRGSDILSKNVSPRSNFSDNSKFTLVKLPEPSGNDIKSDTVEISRSISCIKYLLCHLIESVINGSITKSQCKSILAIRSKIERL